MAMGIRSFSTWLEDVDGFLAEASPLNALDLAIGRLAGVLGFDAAWYGFSAWDGGRVEIAASRTFNIAGPFFDDWRAMRHDDLMLGQIRRAPDRVATYRRRQLEQTAGLMQMARRYDLDAAAAAMSLRPGQPASLFLSCYRNGGDGRPWEEDEQDFLYGAVTTLDRMVRGRAEAPMDTDAVQLHVTPAGLCIFGRQRLARLGLAAEPLLPAPLRAILGRPGQQEVPAFGLIAEVDGAGAGLVRLVLRRAAPADRLSPREAEIAALLARGLGHKEVARRLGLSPVTIRNQTRRIYDKLGINSRAALVTALGSM
ncbi:helix-turn-helix transcriptional regulator [Tistrella mobilis]|uniref:helix-turn-helix transcriptional regulator n=1 Tax=Tistrella mobilis TaxID=171437 RepID=UPI003557C4A3